MNTCIVDQWSMTTRYSIGDRVFVDNVLYQLQEVIMPDETKMEAFVKILDQA